MNYSDSVPWKSMEKGFGHKTIGATAETRIVVSCGYIPPLVVHWTFSGLGFHQVYTGWSHPKVILANTGAQQSRSSPTSVFDATNTVAVLRKVPLYRYIGLMFNPIKTSDYVLRKLHKVTEVFSSLAAIKLKLVVVKFLSQLMFL